MKRLICFLLLWGIVLAIPYSAMAHPPRDIELVFSKEDNMIEISMTHVSSNPRKHFIRKVNIYKNGEEIESNLFTKQTSAQGLTLNVSVAAQRGDVVSIKAICNEAGSQEASITIQ